MNHKITNLVSGAKAGTTTFADVIGFIEGQYTHQPTAFKNGSAYNEATQNQGSAKVLGFAKLNNLSADDTLLLFAEHYRAVLATPDAADHQNIRQFMANGWGGVVFEGTSLIAK
ncbi:MAG: HopJ type III effector protein [Sphingobacteriales bacterium]|nr:MAG: HopJ type III effector protein [Sphingobacteriales bacterium]